MTHAPLSFDTMPGHQVLAAAGKKTLRPGGRAATEQLFAWAQFQPGDRVLELAASFGYSAMALAQRYGVQVVGIEKNPDSVARARANVAAAGLSDQVTILEGDMFHLDRLTESTESFDYVLAEAILSMQSTAGKAKIVQGVSDRLKPGGQFLSHELLVNGSERDAICQDLRATIRMNTSPLSSQDWQDLYGTAGLTLQHLHTGPMLLLNPKRIVQEEGLTTLLTMGWAMLTQPAIRQRIWSMRQVFQHHRDNLGYIVLCLEKTGEQP